MNRAYGIGIILLVGILAGCSSEQKAEEQAKSAAATAPQAENAPEIEEVPAGPAVETKTFTLVASTLAATYEVGKRVYFELVLSGKPGWEVNQEYPIEVELLGPESVDFASKTLSREDAEVF